MVIIDDQLYIGQLDQQIKCIYSFINIYRYQSFSIIIILIPLSNKMQMQAKKNKKKQKVTVEMRPPKTQICRFYLRGLCIKNSHDCQYSHGVWDLLYQPWQEGETIVYDYSSLEQDSKEKIVKGERNYINLYEYQKEKIFTLHELNQDRQKRSFIRNQMHAQMFNDFMDLLTCYYPDALFTQEFLIREFTRVGFNKTMSTIKITHICAFVCDPPSSRFFKINLLMPPNIKKETTYILPCLSDEQNLAFYRSCYEQYAQKATQQELTEANIKKYLFGVKRPQINLLPLNLYLKNKKMSFTAFLASITNNNKGIVLETDINTLFSCACKFIKSKIHEQDGYCFWNDVFKYISHQYKINNANITSPLKPILVNEGFIFLNFPMIHFITSKDRLQNWQFRVTKEQKSVCQCQCKKPYPEQELMLKLINFQDLPPKQSFDIDNMDSLLRCAGKIIDSKIIAVDLEGRLRKNGYIQMIQINNGINTFLIDIHGMLLNADMEAFQLCKKILRNVFCNPNIIKIFHDCRHDCLVLHQIMNTCVINVFDTSAVQTLISQFQTYKSLQSAKQILKVITNVKTPGLNDILKKYNAPHGLNKNKQWFHQLWKKGHTQLFEQRPLNPQYRQYCIKDVLDLPYLREVMLKEGVSGELADWVSSHYVRAGYLYTVEPDS